MQTRFALLVVLAALACSSGGETSVEDALAADSTELSDSTSEINSNDTHEATDQADSLDSLTQLPFEPPAPSTVLTDSPYLQSINHTTNEQPTGLPSLVALALAPQEPAGLQTPVYVSSQGVLRSSGTGTFDLLAVPEGAGQVLDAETSSAGLFLATEHALLVLQTDGSLQPVWDAPLGCAVQRIVPGSDLVVIVSDGVLVKRQGEVPNHVAMTPPPTAALDGTRLILAANEKIAAFSSIPESDWSNADWSISVPFDLLLGIPVGIATWPSTDGDKALLVVGDQGAVLLPDGLTSPSAPLEAFPALTPPQRPLVSPFMATTGADGWPIVGYSLGVGRVLEAELGIEHRLYVPERWMPPGTLLDVLPAHDQGDVSSIYFLTTGGLGSLTVEEWRLAEKMEHLKDIIVERHDRDGAVADSRLMTPGDLSSSVPWDSDNDGGWTCYWVMAECLRYKVTGAPEALEHFDRSLERMLSLRTLTGTQHFLARSVIRIEGCQLDDCDDPDDGEWFLSPDGEWWVKGDTSNDEVDSHMFMMGLAYDLCADETQRQAIRDHVAGIIGGIIDNGYRLIDPQDGEPTKFGMWDPFYVNVWVEGIWGDGGLRSTEMLGALNLAYYMTGEERFAEAKRFLIEENAYDDNVAHVGDSERYPFCAGSGDCDELSMQAFFTLIRYEPDPALRDLWLQGFNRLYSQMEAQEDALWDILNVVLSDGTLLKERVMRWLERYPVDLIRWRMDNTVRTDLAPAPDYYLLRDSKAPYRLRSDGHILPPDERPNERHNTPQFGYTGGHGAGIEMDAADVLFAWWLARYYGFIVEESR